MSLQYHFEKVVLRVRPSILSHWIKVALPIERRKITLDNGLKFWIDPISHLGNLLKTEGVYEPVLTELLETVLRPGDTFIDVGANEGYFTVLAGKRVGEEGKVLAMEPQSRLQSVLKRNLEANSIENTEIHQVACSNSNTETELFLTNTLNTGATSIFRRRKFGQTTEEVHCRRLDEFCRDRVTGQIRFLKMDCEGAEVDAIPGMTGLLRDKRLDFMVVEFHPNFIGWKKCQSLILGIIEKGYELTQLHSGQWVFHLPKLRNVLNPLGPLKRPQI